ncbi:MAG: RusA family crossover junction endodeoxyribonuclease [Hydrococcus sp. CRU_1_1]|nr:RusA family crossover junction endodeoxyribonuclease [Hydrococcus sp. CRU_1_1]
MTQRDRWKHRPCVDRYYQFKDELRLLWSDRTFPDRVKLIFRLPMPDSWSKIKKQQMRDKPHKSKPDVDNLIKCVFDCLLEQDCQIYGVLQRNTGIMKARSK